MTKFKTSAARLLLCFSLFLGGGPARAQPIKVRLFEAHPDIATVFVTGPFTVLRPVVQTYSSGRYTISTSSPGKLEISRQGSVLLSTVHAELRGSSPAGLAVEGLGKLHHYKGSVSFSSHRERHRCSLLLSNEVERRDYIESVVGSETQPDWPREATKAMAVLVQTKLARIMPDETLGDSTQRQAYFGSDYVRPGIHEAVSAVWNKLLCYDKRPIQVFYHSTCAGGTSDGTTVFGKAARGLVYLRGVQCSFCRQSPFWKETVTRIPASAFATEFGADLPQIDGFDQCHRPLFISFNQPGGGAQRLSGYNFWLRLGQRFGWDKAPGLRFKLERQGDTVAVSSTGAGHGVGLCQWGAAEQAKLGKKYEEILRYYFPGTAVE